MSATILTGGGIFSYVSDRKVIVTADFELVRCVAVDLLGSIYSISICYLSRFYFLNTLMIPGIY